MLDAYAKLRPPEYRTPPELLRSLGRQIDNLVLPCIMSLHRRSTSAYYALDEFTRRSVKTDKKAIDEVVRGAKRAEATAKEIVHEIEEIRRELESLPQGSPKRKPMHRALDLRVTELDLLTRRLDGARDRIASSQEKIRRLIPSVAEVQTRVEGLQGKFSKEMFRLLVSDVGARLILKLPIVIAFFTTLALDRAKRIVEPLIKKSAPKDYHDIVLLIFFALQVLALTPAISALSTKLCWHSFDRAMHTVRLLLPQVRDVEVQIAQAEQLIMSLFSKTAQA